MNPETIQCEVTEPAPTPTRKTDGAAGYDLRAAENKAIHPNTIESVPTGVKVAIPDGHVGLLALRSSIAADGLTLANNVGVIDSDYRGEIKAVVRNPTDSTKVILAGERFAQLVIVPCLTAPMTRVHTLDETTRGDGGFGSTGSGLNDPKDAA